MRFTIGFPKKLLEIGQPDKADWRDGANEAWRLVIRRILSTADLIAIFHLRILEPHTR
jgi:hypothetical protein